LGAVGIGLLELLRVTPVLWDITGLTALQVTLGLEDSHLVEQLATTQRVLDEVHMRSDVTDDGLEILHGLILLQLGGTTVGHVGGRDRRILNEVVAVTGVDAVERQEGISVEGGRALLALPLQIDLNAGLGTTGLTNSGTVVQGGTGLTSSIHKDGQQIRAVDDQVAATVVLLELLVEAQGQDGLTGDGITKLHILRQVTGRDDAVDDTPALQHAPTVRADLQAGTDLLELRCTLEEGDVRTAQGQRQGASRATDATARDDNALALQFICLVKSGNHD